MGVVSLSLSQKRKICQHADSQRKGGTRLSISRLAQWAFDKYKLPSVPNKSTMSRVLKKSLILLARPQATLARKTRENHGHNHILEMALFDWIIDQQAKRININGHLIIEKAKRIQIQKNEQVSVPNKSTPNFSAGWLGKFKSRWNLLVFKSHGESGDAREAAARELPLIKENLRGDDPKDIFNADDCGLYFKMAPDKTIYT